MDPISEELEQMIRTVLAPLIEADGGKVYLVRVERDEVTLHLTGRFSGCAGNELVLQRVIQPALERIAADVTVTLSSGHLVPPAAVVVEAAPTIR